MNATTINTVLNEFRDRLLESTAAPHIAKIVFFGSRAKGRGNPESDVDVLIVSSDGETVRAKVAEIAFDLQMKYAVPLEPVIEDIDDLFPLNSYFLYNVLKHGKEIYSMKKKELKKEVRENLVRLAEEYFDSAQVSYKNGCFRLAIDAAYNSAELAVKSLILEKDDDLPGSHGGIISKFGILFVQPGVYARSVGRELNLALELRNSARYKYQAVIIPDQAQKIIALAQKMIKLAADSFKT